MRKTGISVLFLFIVVLVSAQEKMDLEMMNKIRSEGLNNSKVMDIAFYLTDVSGPRLTKSPGYDRAANWAISELKKWGLENAMLEPWGEFGKSWDLQKSYVAMSAPYYRPLIAFPKTWTKGTNGLQNVEVMLITAKDSVELEQYRGKLKGKILIMNRTDTLKQSFKADASRYTDEELQKMAEAKPQQPRQPSGDTAEARRRREQFQRLQGPAQLLNKLKEIADKEGAVAVLSMSPRGHEGTLFVQGGGAYSPTSPDNFLDIMIAFEDYMSICRLLRAGVPVKIEADVKTAINAKDTKGYNVIAEIKGTDPSLKDEIVMLGGHLDSWQGATGATDNAAGCSVMMEAIRILKTLGVKPRRTIRIALWNGEEQGLLGSRGYVKNHFADPATMELKPEHARFSSYFNIDNGTGKIRGIYLQGNEKVKDIFAQWLQPFNDLGAKTITISNTGGTDHQSFDAVGLPGFQFIQDPIEYDTRTHHTNMDSYDHLIADDMKQIATIVAAFVYNAAQRDEKLPRKELPKPREGNQRGF
ncbi:MAG: M20/M25/M40 family metallo-hydrolase [Chitinophagaceae bacterium]|nr:M20/M25/M40 family metallo-hydrolase [Chitinophagaceae bacterium]